MIETDPLFQDTLFNFLYPVFSNEANKGNRKFLSSFDDDFPLLFDLVKINSSSKITPNFHDFFEVLFVYKGKGLLAVENKNYLLKENDIIILSNFEVHTIIPSTNEEIEVIAIYFMPEFIYKLGGSQVDFELIKPFLARNESFSNVIKSKKIDYSYILNQVRNIYEIYIKKEKYYKQKIKIYFLNILLNILLCYGDELKITDKISSKKMKDFNRIKDLLNYLQNEFEQTITLNDAAKMTNMSIAYFCKFFKSLTGKTFTNYLTSIRIDKAKEYILSDTYTITAIAFKVGFENLSYFHRKFRNLTGFSPMEFFKKYRNMSD